MAGFNPIIYGRFWVITEVRASSISLEMQYEEQQHPHGAGA
jgi:hypothetical protein